MSLFRRTRRVAVPAAPPAVLPPSSAFLAPGQAGPSPASPVPQHHEEQADPTTRGPLPGAGGVPVLQLDQGSVLRLDRRWVIGRDPVAPTTHPEAVPFGIADATRSVSKTHLAVGPAAVGAEVVDLHSTNGVSVQRPGSAPSRLVPGEPAVVPLGTTITYGERSIVVQG